MNESLTVVRIRTYAFELVFYAGLLRTSTSWLSWFFEALVPVPKVVGDVLVFVHRRSTVFVIDDQTSGIQSRSLRPETRNLKIQEDDDVDVLRRPGSKFMSLQLCNLFVAHKICWSSYVRIFDVL